MDKNVPLGLRFDKDVEKQLSLSSEYSNNSDLPIFWQLPNDTDYIQANKTSVSSQNIPFKSVYDIAE